MIIRYLDPWGCFMGAAAVRVSRAFIRPRVLLTRQRLAAAAVTLTAAPERTSLAVGDATPHLHSADQPCPQTFCASRLTAATCSCERMLATCSATSYRSSVLTPSYRVARGLHSVF